MQVVHDLHLPGNIAGGENRVGEKLLCQLRVGIDQDGLEGQRVLSVVRDVAQNLIVMNAKPSADHGASPRHRRPCESHARGEIELGWIRFKIFSKLHHGVAHRVRHEGDAVEVVGDIARKLVAQAHAERQVWRESVLVLEISSKQDLAQSVEVVAARQSDANAGSHRPRQQEVFETVERPHPAFIKIAVHIPAVPVHFDAGLQRVRATLQDQIESILERVHELPAADRGFRAEVA